MLQQAPPLSEAEARGYFCRSAMRLPRPRFLRSVARTRLLFDYRVQPLSNFLVNVAVLCGSKVK